MYLRGRLRIGASQFFATLLIFSLSAGVLGGVLIYFDSTGPLILNEMSEESIFDMRLELTSRFYLQDELTIDDILQVVNEQTGISAVEPMVMIESSTTRSYHKVLRTYAYLGVTESFFSEFSNVIQLSDNSIPLGNNGCYVEESWFQQLGLEINGTYSVPIITGGYFYHTTTRNFTVQGTFTSLGLWGTLEIEDDTYSILRMVTSIEAMKDQFGYLGPGLENALHEEVWVNYDPNFITSLDSSRLQSELEVARQRIDQQIVPYATVSEFGLLNAVYGYSSWQTSMRSISIAFSIPTLIMAIMLIQYSSNLTRDAQRREAGLLRIRGASGWQVVRWIMSMALFSGFIGSLGAIVIGYLAALVSGGTSSLMVFDLMILQSLEIVLNPMSILSVFLFTFIIGLLVALPSAIRMIIIEISDAHKVLEQEVTNHDRMVNLGIETAAVVLSGLVCYVLLNATNFLTSSTLALSICFISAFGAFVASLTHLLSRPAPYIKSGILHRLKNPILASVSRLVGRTAIMKRRSETLGIMFISMVFVAGIFSSLSAYSGSLHSEQLIMFSTGADVLIETNPHFHNITLDLIPELKAIDGVVEASGVCARYENVLYQAISPYSTLEINSTMLVVGVQPETWMDTAFWLPYFTTVMTPEMALATLSENEQNTISSFRPINGFELVDDSYEPLYGDVLTLQLGDSSESEIIDLSIIDVLAVDSSDASPKYLPGMPELDEFLIVNIDLLHEFYNMTELDMIYLDLEDDANYTLIEEQVSALSQNGFTSIKCAQEQLEELEGSSMSRSIIGVYSLNILFSLLYLIVGIAIVAVEKNRLMRSDFSLLRAFGQSPSHILVALVVDTALSIAYAALIGGSIGFVLCFLVLNSPLVFIGISDATSWNRLPVILAVPWNLLCVLILVSFLLPLIAVMIVNNQSLKREIASELQVNGG